VVIRHLRGTVKSALIALFLLVASSSPGQAAPLDLDLQPYPDIFSWFIGAAYDATSQQFTAEGYAWSLDDGSGPQDIEDGNFLLTAIIDNEGVASSGALTVTGTFGSFGSPLLTSTNLLGFGSSGIGGGSVLEFLFGAPQGSLTPTVYDTTTPVGVILTQLGGFPGSWTDSWSSGVDWWDGNQGVADIAPVPEPSTLLLVLSGALAARHARRRRMAASAELAL
jgi:hypothetical protein